MIHFDFILDDEEADLVFELLNNGIAKTHKEEMKAIVRASRGDTTAKEEIQWLQRHRSWIESIVSKIKSGRES